MTPWERMRGGRQRVAVTAWAYEILRENWWNCGTYRVLLDELGHGGDDGIDMYRLFMAAGGFDLNNGLECQTKPGEERPV